MPYLFVSSIALESPQVDDEENFTIDGDLVEITKSFNSKSEVRNYSIFGNLTPQSRTNKTYITNNN